MFARIVSSSSLSDAAAASAASTPVPRGSELEEVRSLLFSSGSESVVSGSIILTVSGAVRRRLFRGGFLPSWLLADGNRRDMV